MIYPEFYALDRQRIHVDPKAQALIDLVNPEEMRDMLSQFPSDIPTAPLRDHVRDWLSKTERPPKGAKFESWLSAMIVDKENCLRISLDRYRNLLALGAIDMSTYDLTISSGNNPILAVWTALRLTTAHVLHAREYLSWCSELLAASQNPLGRQEMLF